MSAASLSSDAPSFAPDDRSPAASAGPSQGLSGLVAAESCWPSRAVGSIRIRRRTPDRDTIGAVPLSENLLLKVGAEFQARTGWHRRRPPV